MTGYTKLFGSIVASTIWREPHTVRIVWITMLAMANKTGVVEASLPGLADLSRVTLDECKEAIAALQSPDEYSRTPDFEGRRIEPADGGWKILNHGKYRAKMGLDERREYLRIKQQEGRARRKASTDVNKRSAKSTESTQSEAYSETEEGRTPSRDEPSDNGDHPDAHFPTAGEVRAFGEGAGIPPRYCRRYHDKKTEGRSWLSVHNRLVDWKKQIVRYWADDRATWDEKKNRIDRSDEPVRVRV